MSPTPLPALCRLTRAALVLLTLLALVGCRTTRQPPMPLPEPAAQAAAEPAPNAANAPSRRRHPTARKTSNPVLMYLSERGWDLMDIMGLRFGGGDTFYVRARATKLGIVGLGFFKGNWFGFRRRAGGCWREERIEGGASLFYFVNYKREPLRGNGFLFSDRFPKVTAPPEPWGCTEIQDSDFHWLDIGAGVGLIAVALDVEVSPREVLDFVFGIFCLDICQDDGLHAKPVQARKLFFPAEQGE